MNKRLISLITLLGIIAIMSIAADSTQDNGAARLDNISQENGISNNTGINLSDVNNKTINETDFNKSSHSNGGVFIITSNATARPLNGVGLDVSPESTGVQLPKKAMFLISGYTRPIPGTIYENTSLLNAAYLSRGVEGTPHGYVTYHN